MDALLAILDAMIDNAKAGDVKAAALIFDRLAMPESKDPLVNLQLAQIQATAAAAASASDGPPRPQGGEFSDRVRDLNRVAAQQGLLNGATPAEIELEAIAAAEDEDDEDEEDLDRRPIGSSSNGEDAEAQVDST